MKLLMLTVTVHPSLRSRRCPKHLTVSYSTTKSFLTQPAPLLTNQKHHPHQPCRHNNHNQNHTRRLLLRHWKRHLGPHPLLRLHPPLHRQRRHLRPPRLRRQLHLLRHHVRRPRPLIRLPSPSNLRRKSLPQHRHVIQHQHHRRLPHHLPSRIPNGHLCDPETANGERESVYR